MSTVAVQSTLSFYGSVVYIVERNEYRGYCSKCLFNPVLQSLVCNVCNVPFAELKSVDICDYCYNQLLHENCGKSIKIIAKRSQSLLENACKKCEEELKKKSDDNKLKIEFVERKTKK